MKTEDVAQPGVGEWTENDTGTHFLDLDTWGIHLWKRTDLRTMKPFWQMRHDGVRWDIPDMPLWAAKDEAVRIVRERHERLLRMLPAPDAERKR